MSCAASKYNSVGAASRVQRREVGSETLGEGCSHAKSGLDYLLITSRPPENVKAGTAFSYPIKVKSKNPGVAFKLDSGPKGMEVTKVGVLTWPVPADAAGDHEVILTVSNAGGQEVFHTFTIRIAK